MGSNREAIVSCEIGEANLTRRELPEVEIELPFHEYTIFITHQFNRACGSTHVKV